jgi:predicted CDP-diglyceride synthetase/phosphatidate cytidylyltransferase
MDKYTHPVIFCIGSLTSAEIVGQTVYKCPCVVTASRMDHQSCRLVHYQYIIVFISDIERNLFRDYLKATSAVGEDESDDIEGLYTVVSFDYYIVHTDILGIYRQLYPVAGCVLHPCGEIFVYSEKGLPFVYHESEMLKHSTFGVVTITTFKIDIFQFQFVLNLMLLFLLGFLFGFFDNYLGFIFGEIYLYTCAESVLDRIGICRNL